MEWRDVGFYTRMKVFVLLTCYEDVDLWGNCLFYDSIRNSFPDDEIYVYDNASEPQYSSIFKERTKQIDAEYQLIPFRCSLSDFVLKLIDQEVEPFYLVDPDTIWFDPLIQHYDAAIAGRFMPKFYNFYGGTNELPRIHTCCMFIDPIRCRSIMESSIHDDRLIHASVFSWNHMNYKLDTFSLFYILYPDQCVIFSDDESRKFAHLFCGTHISQVKNSIPELLELHKMIQSNSISPEELYDIHNDYFNQFAWKEDVRMPPFYKE